MRERADELKGKVRQMFGADRATSVAGMVILVDQLERLGLDNHFRDEINAALGRIHSEGLDDAGRSSNLHVVALRFCLLRQHGFWVSTGIDERSSYIKLTSAKLINLLPYRLLEHPQELLIFSPQNLLFVNSLNRYREAKKSSSLIISYFYSKK